jgi:hypothetical protein
MLWFDAVLLLDRRSYELQLTPDEVARHPLSPVFSGAFLFLRTGFSLSEGRRSRSFR